MWTFKYAKSFFLMMVDLLHSITSTGQLQRIFLGDSGGSAPSLSFEKLGLSLVTKKVIK
jgi:DNA mismatch repair protein MutH